MMAISTPCFVYVLDSVILIYKTDEFQNKQLFITGLRHRCHLSDTKE